jgi:hypothetical protein
LLLSILNAFLLAFAAVPVPTTNTVSCDDSCKEPVAFHLPKNALPPPEFAFEPDTFNP